MNLSVVIPVYNVRVFFPQLLELVRAVPYEKEIIVVDDCSTDGTREFVAGLQAAGGWPGDERNALRVALHARNRGKGAAIRTALGLVRGDIVVVQDADLEYDPAQYCTVLAPVLTGVADVVFGSRFNGNGAHRVLYYWHALGNKLLTTLSNMATNINITDMETCYKLFRRRKAA